MSAATIARLVVFSPALLLALHVWRKGDPGFAAGFVVIYVAFVAGIAAQNDW